MTEQRITRKLTLSYVQTADLPVDQFSYAKLTDETGGVTLIPDDLTLLDEGMEFTARELAPLIAKKQTAEFTFEYVSGISEQPIENIRGPDQRTVPMKTYFWRQVQSAGPLQVAVKLSVKQLKKDGAYGAIEATSANDLSESMFAFKVIEMMTSCGMEPLADELVSYVGVGKGSPGLKIDSAYKTSFGVSREFNFGCVALRMLNDTLSFDQDGMKDYDIVIKKELIRGRYIANETGRSIIKPATGLRRSPRIRGPANYGNPFIGDEEVIYERAGYWYDYGMYGFPDPGKYAQERDDQDAVALFPVK